MGCVCTKSTPALTPEEIEERRKNALAAAEERAARPNQNRNAGSDKVKKGSSSRLSGNEEIPPGGMSLSNPRAWD